MPSDFPSEPFEAIHKKLASSSNGREDIYFQFAGAWKALSYRYLALTEHGDSFAAAVTKFGTSPDAIRRYEQERDLFGFFSNGFAAFEAYFYAVFAITRPLSIHTESHRWPVLKGQRGRKGRDPEGFANDHEDVLVGNAKLG